MEFYWNRETSINSCCMCDVALCRIQFEILNIELIENYSPTDLNLHKAPRQFSFSIFIWIRFYPVFSVIRFSFSFAFL